MSKSLTVDGVLVEFLRAWIAWSAGAGVVVFEDALARHGLLDKSTRGWISLTEKGRNLIAAHRHTESEAKP